MANNTILYPNVSRIPGQGGVSNDSARPASEGPAIQKGEFDATLNNALDNASVGKSTKLPPSALVNSNLEPQTGLKFSAHAMQRLRERQIKFDPETMSRMNDAISKADAKGVQDTLVLTDKAALIVSVPNRTVVTAMDRNNLAGNVFTNIDGAVII
ncbi:MAG: hypothetical protein JST80_04210 [Bdellovibrionales bacterium]|nr:hypothetical protein [Bdellovibrionales bacterium]